MIQAFSLGALTSAQLALSLALQIIVIAVLGVGEQTDAWVAAQAMPLVLFGIGSIACQGTWQAEFTLAASDPGSFTQRQQTAHGQLLVALGALYLVLMLSAPFWTPWIFPGFEAHQQSLTAELSVILLASSLVNLHSSLYATAMRAQQTFILPELINVAGSLLSIGFTILTIGSLGVFAAAWGLALRSFLVGAALFVLSGRATPSFSLALRDAAAWHRMKPLLFSYSLTKTAPLVDRFLGSMAPAGSLTTFNLALTGMTALSSVIEKAVTTVPATALGNLVRARDFEAIRRTYRSCLNRVTAVAVIVLVCLLLLSFVWSDLARMALKLQPGPANDIWWYALLLSAFIIPSASGTAFTFSFYAFGDTRTPARVASIGFLVSIGLKAVGFYLFGILGIVLAILAHYFGNLVAFAWLLERRLRREQGARDGTKESP